MIEVKKVCRDFWRTFIHTPNIDKALDRLSVASQELAKAVDEHQAEVKKSANRHNGHTKIRASAG